MTPDEFERYREWGLEKASKKWYQASLYDQVIVLSVFSNLITLVYRRLGGWGENANCCVSLIGGNALASLGLSITKNRIDGFTVLWVAHSMHRLLVQVEPNRTG